MTCPLHFLACTAENVDQKDDEPTSCSLNIQSGCVLQPSRMCRSCCGFRVNSIERCGSSWDSRVMNTVVHRRESCPGSCPRVCTRGRSAGITPRRYRGTGFVRSLDLDQFHVLHYFFCSFSLSASPAADCLLPPDGPLMLQLFPLRLEEKAGVFVQSLSPKKFTSCADNWATSW